MRVTLLIFTCLLFSNAFSQNLHFQSLSNLNEIRKIVIDHDTLWIATGGGVQKRLSDGTLLATYTKANSLGINLTTDIFIDKEGNKWFSGSNIITKYDNNEFTSFQVPDSLLVNSSISSFAVDSVGQVWFGLYKNALKYDGNEYQVYDYAELGDIGGSSANDITIDSQGHIWFATRFGIFMFDGEQWTSYDMEDGLPDNSCVALQIDEKGSIWVATRTGVARYDGQIWQPYSSGQISDLTINDFYVYEDQVWIATLSGIAHFDGTTWHTSLVDDEVHAIAASANGTVWFQNKHALGLHSFTSNNQVQSWLLPTTIAGNNIFEMTTDTTGALWFATDNGVSQYNGEQWITYRQEDGLVNNHVFDIDVDHQNQVWMATTTGVSRYDGQSWQTFTTAEGLSSNRVIAVKGDLEDNVWLGTIDQGVMKYDGTSWTSYTTADGLISDYITCIAIDSLNRVIVGGYDGISIFDGTSWTNRYIHADGGTHTDIVDAVTVDDQQRIWIGSLTNGVNVIEGDSIYRYKAENSFLSSPISAIAVKGNTTYVVTNKGLSINNDSSWQNYTYQDGLPFINSVSLYIDLHENLWIGGTGGLYVAKFKENHAPTNILAERDTIPLLQDVNTFITGLLTVDEDLLDIYYYELIPDLLTDYEYVTVVADQLWLSKTLSQDKTVLSIKIRSTDVSGDFIDKLITLRVNKGSVITSVPEKSVNTLNVYPVPTQDKIQIEGINSSAQLSLYDLWGNQEKIDYIKRQDGTTEVNLQHLSAGIYLLRIFNRQHWHTLRVVKQ
ncbi:ligand-binding sensor domain-containing protein [Catalinimonas niigatensis]|uniref:ligand-binding sensor domain-containing protein n=1 Tax=Catalinimonas niigatensis TaxID=1397264 RepID=UPI002666538A|nr:T9SS type A sorting domain-containing protein [Catalinimonas niigatensis]WPP47966.1 T9SS type A sorting domain-containing protein [Catalinimonas niigatensis]